MKRIFILSPASTAGERAALVYNPRTQFDLAQRMRSANGVPLGEAFSFLSGLYFRGKLTYATRFAKPPKGVPGVLVITSNRGLWPADEPVTLADLRSFSEVPIRCEGRSLCRAVANARGIAGQSRWITLRVCPARKHQHTEIRGGSAEVLW